MSAPATACRRASRSTALALALAGTIAALAGCGGGSSRPTKAQYIERANAICQSEKLAMRTIALAHESLLAAADRSNRTREDANAKLEALSTPSSEAISPEWFTQRHAALTAAKAFSAAKLGTAASRAAGKEYFTASSRAAATAKAYGLGECGGFAAS